MINLQAVGISRNGQDTQNGEARGLEAPEPASTKAHTRAYMGRRGRCEALLKTEGQVCMRPSFVRKVLINKTCQSEAITETELVSK